MNITEDYIKECLDARGYEISCYTVRKAHQAWTRHLEREEDNHLIDIIEGSGVKLKLRKEGTA
jgi:hypothetical protein